MTWAVRCVDDDDAFAVACDALTEVWRFLNLATHPVVRARGIAVASVAEIDAFFDEMARLFVERPGPYVLVIDARGSAFLDAALRKHMARRLNEQAPLRKQWCRGVFVVVDSALLRGMLRALAWLVNDPTLKTTADIDVAVAAAEKLMRSAA